MHPEILTPEQIALLPTLSRFIDDFGLVGGTAAALQIGHRHSIDFDLFSLKEFANDSLRMILKQSPFSEYQDLVDRPKKYTIIINQVKVTFYHYRFPIEFPILFESSLKMADLVMLAAMKIHALGQRAKWKDYVDLYYILKNHHTMAEISARAEELLGAEFNEKLFRLRLAYFYDVRYDEVVEFLPGYEVSHYDIKDALTQFSLF